LDFVKGKKVKKKDMDILSKKEKKLGRFIIKQRRKQKKNEKKKRDVYAKKVKKVKKKGVKKKSDVYISNKKEKEYYSERKGLKNPYFKTRKKKLKRKSKLIANLRFFPDPRKNIEFRILSGDYDYEKEKKKRNKKRRV
jgi:hypothetical protein